MDPISIAIEIELATLVLAGVGAFATWLHHKQKKAQHRQAERHHRELKAQHDQQYTEQMTATVVDQLTKTK